VIISKRSLGAEGASKIKRRKKVYDRSVTDRDGKKKSGEKSKLTVVQTQEPARYVKGNSLV